jgi:hypothetical protein
MREHYQQKPGIFKTVTYCKQTLIGLMWTMINMLTPKPMEIEE